MLQQVLIYSRDILAGGAIDKDAVKDIHSDYLVAETVNTARFRLEELLPIIVEVYSVAVEYGVLAACDAYHVELQTPVAFQFVILRAYLLDKFAANGAHSADEEVEDVVFGEEERVVKYVQRLSEIFFR